MRDKGHGARNSSRRKVPELPDTKTWQPRDGSRTLHAVALERCRQAEQRLLLALEHAAKTNLDAFNAGLAFEAAVRSEIADLLPSRYSIDTGQVIDCFGRTSGQCDIVLFNKTWVSPIRSTILGGAGDTLFPVEGVYAVGEVKQTLGYRNFDDAMKKLVVCNRLERRRAAADRITENWTCKHCPHGMRNPLYTFLVAGRLEKGLKIEDFANRFYDINRSLKRTEVVRSLCVLETGTILWFFRDPSNEFQVRQADFVRDDLFHPIFPVFIPNSSQSPFHSMIFNIMTALHKVTLATEFASHLYSGDSVDFKIPKSPEIL